MKPSQQQEIEHSPLRMLALQVSGEGGEGKGREEKENRKEERGEEMNLLQPLVMCVV